MGADEDRLGQFLAGDEKVFDSLLHDYQALVFAIIMRRSGCRGEEAEDLFQEVWRRVIEHGASFDLNTSFRAWLYAITRNVCADYHRAGARAPLRASELGSAGGDDQDDGPDFMTRIPDEGPGPIAPLLRNDLREALAQCRARISDEDLEMTVRLYVEGKTQREMANALGKSLGTVNAWFHQACAQLRRCLERKGWEGMDAEDGADGA
jgi:RNA polymerase sigma-70 factor, ECF subfamily